MLSNLLKIVKDTVVAPVGRLATGVSVSLGLADTVLETGKDYFLAADSVSVTELVFQATIHTVKVMTDNLANVLHIFTQVFNENSETLNWAWRHRTEFFTFLIDLAGAVEFSKSDKSDYNEWYMTSTKNIYAIRLILSLVSLLANKDKSSVENLDMNTVLHTDFKHGIALPPTTTAKLNAPEEKWLFLNGICGEYQWLELGCNKLRDRFKKEITGIFNRSDGIIWDLIECAGERNEKNKRSLLQLTKSSMDAQNVLKKELVDALWPNTNGKAAHQVVMIAHSQGCLILRLVLQKILDEYKAKAQRDDLINRLNIFTFGNPGLDWKTKDGSESLHRYTKLTEHFANKEDFVAKLGILNSYDFDQRGYLNDHVFISECKGHWFGSQYSLSKDDYYLGENSMFLNN
ncbi:hypothetical protein E3Q11_03157 [Wallemia mellicola]|uniref:DUF676 domain-containing protein n=1 Tax=Wallemia mellicola TaxID=1708541 RepID=A0A4T0TG74_9BASI|nr:hypothetical protein E3Q11_03157 [Wallemia mellicola]TIC51748.1 hypothetical protein E3Q05_03014 [Wallemia mellicola]TIC63708.1 hypothetical protein E3Q01_03213 [Wallemia mellicola]